MSHSTKPRAIEIEQQLAQLRWRRMQNERSIKSYLEATKVMKQKDTILGLTIDMSAERMTWLDGVVRDELARPLVLTDSEVHTVEYDEHKVKKRLLKYSEQQLHNLQKLEDVIEARNPRTKDGIRIRQEQLQSFEDIKVKLQENKGKMEERKPYINVRQVVKKLY